MKLLALLMLAPLALLAAEVETESFYKPGVSFDLFGSARTYDLNDARGGVGLGANWYFANNLGIGVEGLTENTAESFVDFAQVNALWRITSGRAALNITGGAGWSFDPPGKVTTKHVTTEPDDELFVAVGVGPEYAFSKAFHVFAEGRAVKPVEGGDIHALFRAGLRLSF